MEPVLHGRDPALSALRAALDGALGGRGRLAVVSGEAGIGKSALAAALARDAEAKGVVVTWGRAWEFAEAPPYFPVWPCLRALGLGDRSTEGDAFHLWERVVTDLARASASAPAMWILEDLHAADLGTLDLLTFLAQQLRAMRVLVLVTVRANDPRLTDRMTQRLTRLTRDGIDLRLEPLSPEDVAAITAETVGRAVPAPALKRLYALTGGNPLFVVECARAFRAAGGVEGTLGSLPATVRQVVLDRLALVPESTQRALQNGAALGREFAAATVARMQGALSAQVIDALLPALRAGLVAEARPGTFVFSHVLVRDAVYDGLGARERSEIHARAEAALARLGDSAEVLVERARHALLALAPGREAHALDLARRATAMLEREGAYDRAFELSARVSEARAAGLLPAVTGDELLHAARIAREAGHNETSRRACEQAVATARVSGDASLLARAALLHSAEVRPGILDRAQVALLEEALSGLGDADPALACRVQARLATALTPASDQSVPRAMAERAIARARELADDALLLDVLELGSWAFVAEGRVEERSALWQELLDRALAANDMPRALLAHANLASEHLERGDFEAFGRETDAMLALSDDLGHPRYRWRALLLASARACTLGRFEESDRCVTEVRELADLVDEVAIGLVSSVHELLRKRLQRRDDEVRVLLAKIEGVMAGAPEAAAMASALRAGCFARMEDVEATRAELAILGARAAGLSRYPPFAAFVGEAFALAGSMDQRREARARLAELPSEHVSGGAVPLTYEGTTTHVIGLLDAALGDHRAAEEHLRSARTAAEDRGHAPWAAQITYELAKVLRARGRADEARSLMDECARAARALDMRGLAASAGAVVREPASEIALGLAREGELWCLTRGEAVARVKDSRGMHLLARLVERPHEEVHVLVLASDDAGASLAESDAGEQIDERALAAYRKRITELEKLVAQGDARAQAYTREREQLLREISRATGLGGRARRAGSATERARVNVQRRLKDAIARVGEVDEGLGAFLESSVHTGTYCCFRP